MNDTSNLAVRQNTIRIQYQRINYVGIAAGVFVVSLTSILTNGRMNSISSMIVVGIAGAAAMIVSRLLVMKFGVGTSLIPTGPFVESTRGRTDNDILLDEFVRLGGKSARQAASNLPDDIGERSFVIGAQPSDILESASEFFKHHGLLLQNQSSEASASQVKGLLGCGVKQMNPALVTVTVTPQSDNAAVAVHGISKEGAVKQQAGGESAEIVAQYLLRQFKSGS